MYVNESDFHFLQAMVERMHQSSRRTSIWSVHAAFLAAAIAGPAVPAPAQPLQTTAVAGTGRVEGRLVLAGTDAPVASAVVTIRGASGTMHAMSGEDGEFVIDALLPGSYEILVEVPGLLSGRAAVEVHGDGVSRVVLTLEASETAGTGEVIEIQGRYRDEAQSLRESAEAVVVVETEEARRASADLGEVLARSQGVGVRRSGGLGSDTRFSLNGLQDDQIRLFLDGVPLELAGYGLGLANVPVNLVDRVEIYRGVVPSRFGSDALGGAINLVTDQGTNGAASVSYQAGSFGTHRVTAAGRAPVGAGVLVRGATFVDVTRNDYHVDVEVPDERGRLTPARVERFHDGYRAAGGNLDVDVAGPGDGRVSAGGFVTTYDKDLQHNLVMTVPYGEARYGELSWGGTLRWQAPRLTRRIGATAMAAYGHRRIDFVDRSVWVYDWFGARIGERTRPGEIGGQASDQTIREDSVMARAGLDIAAGGGHTLRIAWSPSATTRAGRDRLHTGDRDPLSARRDLLQLVTGVEHELDALDGRLENVLFLKDYVMLTATEEALPGGAFQPLERTFHRLGVGDAARLRLREDLWLKASYELATRLPRPDEIFGDGVIIKPNLALAPETSHNANAGLGFDLRATRAGTFRGEINAFLREADKLIVLLGDDRAFTYQNLLSGRVVGAEAALAWTAAPGWIDLDGSVTLQDLRNTSRSGPFGGFEGDRIPNRPWLLASGGVRLRRSNMLGQGVDLWTEWTTRYVHRFFRSWERVGSRDSKQVVPSQLVHSASIGASLARRPLVTATLELHNLTDARAYDFFGVQKPGRALYFKLTAEY